MSSGQASFSLIFRSNPIANDGNVTISYSILQLLYATEAGRPSNATYSTIFTTPSPVLDGIITQLIEIPVLPQSMTYEFVAVAQNSLGKSPYSPSMSITIPTVISRPSVLYAELDLAENDNSSIILHWSGDLAAEVCVLLPSTPSPSSAPSSLNLSPIPPYLHKYHICHRSALRPLYLRPSLPPSIPTSP